MSDLVWHVATQVQPWFENYGLVGGLAGGGVGVLGAVYGTTVGVLAPRGKGRAAVFAMHWTFLALGVLMLAAGITALATGQPYGVWYALLLPGALVTIMMMVFLPIVRVRYQQAEHRRLEAEEFRQG
ncbi:MAG: hypothetical protein ACYTES_09155 [Planctomycetota bacterium]|jgi:hypothetical protein